jgi:hypothetical protein
MRFRPIFVFAITAACGGVISGTDAGTDSGNGHDVSTTCSCSSSQFCEHDKTCGSTTGTCAERPLGCPDIYSPVCGYDGNLYPNACAANAAGVDVSPDGGCQPPAGWVSCGPQFCDATTSYCQSTGNDAIGPGQPCTYYSCNPLPSACIGSKDCSCFGTTACSSTCTWDGSGFQLVCMGG